MTLLRAMWDRVLAWILVIVGAVALLLGWTGASNTVYPAEQIPFVISGAILGLFLMGIGATLLISADLRDEWRKLDEIRKAIATGPPLGSDGGAGANEGSQRSERRDVVAVAETDQRERPRRGRRTAR